MDNINLITIFLTGLLTGGLTCMAVQGGLLMTTLANVNEEKLKKQAKGGNALPIIGFLIAKLIAYTLLGFLLGGLGSVFQLNVQAQAILFIGVSIFMIGTALNILEVHPLFRYFVIQPPRFLSRLIRKESKSQSIFAPAALGAFTIFIPCGTTQAMMALSIASGSSLLGAATLFAFTLGTSPVFFLLGYFAMKLGDIFQKNFMRLAALVIIILALFNINNALALIGINHNISLVFKNVWCTLTICEETAGDLGEINNNPTITIKALGYSPRAITVQKGAKVNIKLVNTDGANCAQAFTIPSLGIQKLVVPGKTEEVSFIAPSAPTQIPFMCSMGMYRGVINVI